MRRSQIQISSFILVLVLAFSLVSDPALAKRRKKARRYGPPPTHPVVLWARTLSESTDREQRKIAAFKLSQYSQPIFQYEVIHTIEKCMKDQDIELRALCVKAMGRAGTQASSDSIRQALLERYKADPTIRNTVVRTFIVREDRSNAVQDTLLDALKNSKDEDETLVLLKYFESYGSGSEPFTETLVGVYRKNDNDKIKSAVVTALSARARGQDPVIALFAECTESHNTPLVLDCLAGLQQQGKRDPRTWTAIEKTMQSDDPDVLMASLDVINSLPETQNAKVSARLIELVDKTDDDDLQEKIVLALGVCGDGSEATVGILQRLLQEKSTDDGVRTAAALTLGKQGDQFPDKAQEALSSCSKQEKSQALRTACQLGEKEVKARQVASAKSAPKTNTPDGENKTESKSDTKKTEASSNSPSNSQGSPTSSEKVREPAAATPESISNEEKAEEQEESQKSPASSDNSP